MDRQADDRVGRLAADGKATREDVVTHASPLRESAARLGWRSTHPEMTPPWSSTATILVTKPPAGCPRFAGHLVVAYVHVMTDDASRSCCSSGVVTAEEALTSLIQTLDQIRGLIPAEKASWDGDLVLRLAIERLSIAAGNCAEEYLGMV